MSEENIHEKNYAKIFLLIALFLVFANLVYLDLSLFSIKSSLNNQIISSLPSPTPNPLPTTPYLCPQNCLDEIKAATSSANNTPTPAAKSSISKDNDISSSVKEFFVPFGSGSSTASDWQDVAGLQATVDTANYSRIKTVTFEATIHIPTGNESASVRLFNSTDKHPVWFSEVTMDGAGPKFLVSPTITLDKGQKTYQVQAKTSLQFNAIIDQSRIHIITY